MQPKRYPEEGKKDAGPHQQHCCMHLSRILRIIHAEKKYMMTKYKSLLGGFLRQVVTILMLLCPGFSEAGQAGARGGPDLEAITSATQSAESRVAVVKAPVPSALQADSSGPFGLGEIGRMVSEALGQTGLPNIWTGSSVRNLMILADISRPVYDSGVNTNPHVAAALVRELFRMDSTLAITLACAPEHWVSAGTPGAPDSLVADGFASAGFSRMVESLHDEIPGLSLTLEDLNLDSTRECSTYKELPEGCDSVFSVASRVAGADYLIVLARLKTGPLGLDCAMGTLGLALPGPENGWPRFGSVEPMLIDETLVSLLSSLLVDYVLVDALSCLEGAGTDHRQVKDVGALVAGEDLVSVEAVAAWLAGFDPLDMEYLDLAGELSLGVLDPERITILGSVELPADQIPLARPKRRFADPELANPEYPYQGQGVRRLLYGLGEQAIENPEQVYLPFPGAEGWVEAERSRDEILGPGDSSAGSGAFHAFTYFWCPQAGEAQLWVGSQGPVRVYLNGRMVLERTLEEAGDLRVPNRIEDLTLPAGGGTLEVYGELDDNSDPEGLLSLHLARRTQEIKYAGSRVSGLEYFVDPTGGGNLAGVEGTAAADYYVRATSQDGSVQTSACGAGGAYVLRELRTGITELEVLDSLGRQVAKKLLYLKESETVRLDFEPTAPGPAVTGDYNWDGVLELDDVIALILGMQAHPGDLYYDFNRDGRVNIIDAIVMLIFMRPG
jgi:uncharacterized protein (DUF362 family)